MPKIIEEIKHVVDHTIPEIDEVKNDLYPRIIYTVLLLRNFFVAAAVVLFAISFFVNEGYNIFKSVGYFCGAAAYIFELLAATHCFRNKVPHNEMFMIYCFGPLYLLMGFGYIFLF